MISLSTDKLNEHARRFLAGVYGPLGPVAAMTAWDAGVTLAEQLSGTDRGRYSLAAAIDQVCFADEHVPDYLRGLSRAGVWHDTADYVDAHDDVLAELRGRRVAVAG